MKLRSSEEIVLVSLSKILFEAHELYASLSTSFQCKKSILTAIDKFEETAARYHSDISTNMNYLSHHSISLIYKFYLQLSELKIELNESIEKEYMLTSLSVFHSAQDLIETLSEIQELFIKEHSDQKIEFEKKTQQDLIKTIQELKPSAIIKNDYNFLNQELAFN